MINFPNSPTIGQQTTTTDGTVYEWDGVKWVITPSLQTDISLTNLNSITNGGAIPDVDYNWFKGVYASLVDGSVLSWIKGLVNQVKSLATRVGVLEDKYILRYVVPATSSTITISKDSKGNNFNFPNGTHLLIEFDFIHPPSTNGPEIVVVNSSELETGKYFYASAISVGFPIAAASSANIQMIKGVLQIVLNNNECAFSSLPSLIYTGGTYNNSFVNGGTISKNINSITSISFIRTNLILQGSIITIKAI